MTTPKLQIPIENIGETSDGYHTFNELYDHRITLFIALCKKMLEVAELRAEIAIQKMKDNGVTGGIEDINPVWRSKKHSDGSVWDGWFIVGLWTKVGEQITYHLPLDRWDDVDFAETLSEAPEYDGHTPDDVLRRLKGL